MATCTKQETITYTLELSEIEHAFLKALLQNPIGQEHPGEKNQRERLFAVLHAAERA